MAAQGNARVPTQEPANKGVATEQRLLWNSDNVKDVAESLGISKLGEEELRTLSQDVEYRIGQIIIESLRYMRASKRSDMVVDDVSEALRTLNVEPLFGYITNRPLKYGEASLGSQALYYVEDEEQEFEKMINYPLPKIPRDSTFTQHWLAHEGALVNCPENVSTAETRAQDMAPKGPGANPALAALAGQDNPAFKPSVRHVVSQELTLYFEKIQTAVMDERPDAEVQKLREAALESVSSESSIHQLVPYFVQFISNEVTHHLDDIFVLRQMMELTRALINNKYIFLSSYASSLCAPALTCVLGRKIGREVGEAALRDQYQLREFAGSLVGQLCQKYAKDNKALRPKLVRTCLKNILKTTNPPSVWYGALWALTSAGGPEVVRIILLPNLKKFETNMLIPLGQKTDDFSRTEYESLIAAILRAVQSLVEDGDATMVDGANGHSTESEASQIKSFLGDIIGDRILRLGNHELNRVILETRHTQ